jgi:PAS domain-containing protein
MFGYFLLALVSWLSSRSLEQALQELRVLNRDLDHRVEVRTRELSEALTRELIEAGKTQAILQGIADGVLVFDQTNKIIVANPSMGSLTGIRPNKLIGLDIPTF